MAKYAKTPIIVENIDGDGFHIFTELKIGRKKLRALIDTGASKSVLDASLASKIKGLESIDQSESLAKGIGEQMLDTKIALLPRLKIGDLLIEKMYVGVLDLSHIATMYKTLGIEPFSVIMGSDILQEYEAEISFRKCQLSLKLPKPKKATKKMKS